MKEQKANTLLKEKLRRCASKHRVAHPFMQRGTCGMQYAPHTQRRAVPFCSGASDPNRTTQPNRRGLSAAATR